MKQKTFLQTFLSRFLILVFNFGLVIYSTNVWGSEGKGSISIVIADLALISFFSNLFVGGSITFFAPKFKSEQILLYAYIWSFIVGLSVPFIFNLFHPSQFIVYLIGLSISLSLLTANINLFVGKQKLNLFNIYTLLQQILHVVFIIVLVNLLKVHSFKIYFIAQITCCIVLFMASFFQLSSEFNFSQFVFSKKTGYEMFKYGWKTQFSAFVQFLNYRLSYYFLEFYKGISSVGIFSVGVAFSESVWLVSRSLAIILYSEVVNSESPNESLEKTKISLRISFLVSFIFIVCILIIPSSVFSMIFGESFYETKSIILLLSPGILAIASSNVVGYYFAGVNKLKILNIKSLIGLVFTVFASIFIIPKWGILGACLVTSISYCLSSAVLFWGFYQYTEFRFSDLFIKKDEINILFKKIGIGR